VIKLKRAYDSAGKDDGMRFLVERLWPRGVSKTAEHRTAAVVQPRPKQVDRVSATVLRRTKRESQNCGTDLRGQPARACNTCIQLPRSGAQQRSCSEGLPRGQDKYARQGASRRVAISGVHRGVGLRLTLKAGSKDEQTKIHHSRRRHGGGLRREGTRRARPQAGRAHDCFSGFNRAIRTSAAVEGVSVGQRLRFWEF
jgi:hypothetical protein